MGTTNTLRGISPVKELLIWTREWILDDFQVPGLEWIDDSAINCKRKYRRSREENKI